MAILGILFVTGMTFLATMNFESQRIAIEREADQDEVGVELVESIVDRILRESLMPIKGAGEDASKLGEWGTSFKPNRLAWAELPVVHGLIAQIEPYVDDNGTPDPLDDLRVYGFSTNLGVFGGASPWSPMGGRINTQTTLGFGSGATVDSDGDGIADAVQVDLGASGLGISRAQVALVSRVVNGPSLPWDSRPYVGVRVIAHGGMVNLSESHPSLIRTLFDDTQPLANYHTPSRNQIPYSAHAEEASLRNRFFLLPRALSPTVVQGDPLYGDPDNPDGDFAQWLFPPGEDVRTDFHRYWPFRVGVDYQIWGERMNPAAMVSNSYDRRHLVTTISHDDLRSRGGWMQVYNANTNERYAGDLLDRMIEVNVGECTDDLPFEYADYPHTIPNGYLPVPGQPPLGWCDCFDGTPDAGCEFNVRKGRLRLSLPWLDEALDQAAKDPGFPLAPEDLPRLIQDVFTMMLLNARSPYWGHFEPGGVWSWEEAVTGMDIDRLPEIERTAAALAANMWDFADADDLPTRVELRSADITDPAQFGQPNAGLSGIGTAGEYVYGLERQPFITEVAAFIDPNGPDAYAVELFNPYDGNIELYQDIDGDGISEWVFALRVGADGSDIPLEGLELTEYVIPAGDFLPVLGGDRTFAWDLPGQPEIPGDPYLLTFGNGQVVYLLRRVWYTGDPQYTMIVLDQFTVAGGVGVVPPVGNPAQLRSVERGSVTQATPWFAPVPTSFPTVAGTHSIGEDNTANAAAGGVLPVEVLFANDRGSSFAGAFPTTGSLLLLMRFANRNIDDPDPNLAFTTKLVGTDDTQEFDCYAWNADPNICDTPNLTPQDPERSLEIDNGRMPVFDDAKVHHFDLDYDPTKVDPVSGGPISWQKKRPGELYHLPWGQLVFDYFTALPLSNPGPYSNPKGEQGFEVDEAARPRVDLDGLRVHGRMNINAAPWMALRGLPFIPMEKIPDQFRARIRLALGLVAGGALDPLDPTEDEKIVKDYEAAAIESDLAKAIVAYREVREVAGSADYAAELTGRGWNVNAPAWRRGTGFMSVGELANVRHPAGPPGAPDPAFLIDAGYIEGGGSYLDAIARLVSLGDWVSVRSHVFTIYGTIRGDPDPTLPPAAVADDVDARAIRFQETVDRLPTFIGASAPVRIGERVLTRYNDLRSD